MAKIIDYEQLHKENLDSVFILNKRDPKKLLKSFKNWKKMDKRLYEYSPEIVINKTDEGFIEFVEKFYKDIENYFSKYPKSKFITFDIEKDNVKKLEKYIDTLKEMPHKNKN